MFRQTIITAAAAVAMIPAAACATTGPSSSQTPYLTPSAAGVEFTSILTVGDTVKKKNKGSETYRMVGIPDGLGAYDNGDGTITVLMNQELGSSLGAVRAHGSKGAFVSQWTVRKSDLAVLKGKDLMENVVLTSGGSTAFNRFCSADLAATTAYFNSTSGKGFNEGRIFLNGEETSGGRAMAHMASGRDQGTSYELAALGTAAWENLVASPFEQDKTVVAGMDDGSIGASKVYIYVGQKQEEGSPIEMAGLTNGTSFQVLVQGAATEASIGNDFSGAFSLVTTGGTGLNRVEDGAWDTVNPNRFYFVTTDSFNGNTRLWRMTFSDITNPTAGGMIEVLVNGVVDGQKMMDNITVDAAGNVYMQEDVGNNVRLGKIWKYDTTGALTELAEHDANRFINGAPGDIDGSATKAEDEESSGIIEVTSMFEGVDGYDTANNRYFLLDVQAHYATGDAETVEGGQFLMMKAPK